MFKKIKSKFMAANNTNPGDTETGDESNSSVVINNPYTDEYLIAFTGLLQLLQPYMFSQPVASVELVEFGKGQYGFRVDGMEFELDTLASMIEIALVNRFNVNINSGISQNKEKGIITREMKIALPIKVAKEGLPYNDVMLFTYPSYINRFDAVVQLSQDIYTYVTANTKPQGANNV